MRLKLYTNRKHGILNKYLAELYCYDPEVPEGYPKTRIDWHNHLSKDDFVYNKDVISFIMAYHSGNHIKMLSSSYRGLRKEGCTW